LTGSPDSTSNGRAASTLSRSTARPGVSRDEAAQRRRMAARLRDHGNNDIPNLVPRE